MCACRDKSGLVTTDRHTPVKAIDAATASGVVRGAVMDGVRVWRGIPYATAPTEELRFLAPIPPSPWRGVLDAVEFGPIPPQDRQRGYTSTPADIEMSEDCLSINVVAPDQPTSRLAPVMVFIYGGAYSSGSSASELYDGAKLVKRGNIVFVSFNYRLGPLGFLDFSQYSNAHRRFDTNVGLRDQVAALRWVQENIASFGGDPDNVTLCGQSAGAISVTTLMAVPSAQGLFTKAIAQSPAVATAYSPERTGAMAADFLDILGVYESHAPEFLGKINYREFIRAAEFLKQRRVKNSPGAITFSPVVDGDFLPRSPVEAFRDGETHPVPLIIGTTDREGAYFARMGQTIPTTVPLIEKTFAQTDPDARSHVLAAYPGYPARQSAIDIGGDLLFWHPTVEAAAWHCQIAPTYMYRYDFAPRLMRMLKLDATHGTDLFPVFGALDSRAARTTTALGGARQLRDISRRMQNHWLAFIRHGAPKEDWPEYLLPERATKVFNIVDTIENDPRAERRTAWAGFHNYQ